MIKRFALLVLLLTLPSVMRAQAPWSRADVGLAAGFAASLWLDAAQTRYCLAHGGHEGNPLQCLSGQYQ